MSDTARRLPELLCPAGSPEALDAAIEGGADAVYLGGAAFNARMNAHHFGGDALRSAVLRAHAHGVKVYLTLNTLVTDRELPAFVETAREAARAGVDALIVADLGGAAAIHRAIPSLELHASTQMSGHSLSMAEMLHGLGFSRAVMARETPARDLEAIIRQSPIEIEMFVHGALCVSHSGQCLFSSLVGGRSGNRGECAQPCRLPYTVGGKQTYPLSLKDLSLARHVPRLIHSDVASLKIEGRMKSPEYVYHTARIWRTLLDEGRAATPAEEQLLSRIFSRGGLTDGYYTERISHAMLGIRSEGDKAESRTLEPFRGLSRRIPLTAHAVCRPNAPMTLTLTNGQRSVTVTGDTPAPAQTAPLSEEALRRSLTRTGGTPYEITRFTTDLTPGLMLPVSRLNELRRAAVTAWEQSNPSAVPHKEAPLTLLSPEGARSPRRTALFFSPEQVTREARAYFDRVYLPLECSEQVPSDGVLLPPVIFDHEAEELRRRLASARKRGVTYALVGNHGHIALAREAGLTPIGDYRLNLTNTQSVRLLETLGVREAILSPELTLPQLRDIGGDTAAIVYGRIPLMTLEKCVSRELIPVRPGNQNAACRACRAGEICLRDRKGVEFPVLRAEPHRSLVLNSIPTGMSDRTDALDRAGIIARHFLFTVESPAEVDAVIRAYRDHTPLPFPVRRI